MRVNPKMTEYEFIEEIDDNFIFDEDREYEEAARAGAAISDNAALMVAYELAKGGSPASKQVNLALLDILGKERPTSVVQAAVPVVKTLLEGQAADAESVGKLLTACREHTSAWAGLGILLCADESLEPEVDVIMERYRSADGG